MVGSDDGGGHRNFNVTITDRFVVTLTDAGGGLPLGGDDGINQGALRNSVTSALKTRFRQLIATAPFNNLGRSAHRLTLYTLVAL